MQQESGAYARQTDQYELSITRQAYDEEAPNGYRMGDAYRAFNNQEIGEVIKMLKPDEKALVVLQDFPKEKNFVSFTYTVTDTKGSV